jgi:nicotinate dehydrogenase subunit A
MELIINGKTHRIEGDANRSLLEVLRDELDLTGAKYGCGEGQCGACTVLAEGAALRSCVVSAAAVAGRRITTIEGLAQDERLHPVQEAFLAVDAFQCGYCTPGMILSAVALLERNPRPTRQAIVNAMQGNICRCGGYNPVVEAIELGAENINNNRP